MTISLLPPEVLRYLSPLELPGRDPVLQAMARVGLKENYPLVSPDVGRILSVLVRCSNARKILEANCGIGSGTLYLVRGAPEATVWAWDPNADLLAHARELLGTQESIQWHVGGPELAAASSGPLDMAVLRGDPGECRRAVDHVLGHLRLGGLLVVDGLLLQGRVLDGESEDEDVEAARMLPPYLYSHPQLEAQLLAVGDGVGLAVKTRSTILEQGGPLV